MFGTIIVFLVFGVFKGFFRDFLRFFWNSDFRFGITIKFQSVHTGSKWLFFEFFGFLVNKRFSWIIV